MQFLTKELGKKFIWASFYSETSWQALCGLCKICKVAIMEEQLSTLLRSSMTPNVIITGKEPYEIVKLYTR